VKALLIGLLAALVTTNLPAGESNVVKQTTGDSVSLTNAADPVEKEYQALLADDDAAQAEVDKWIQENSQFSAKGAGASKEELNRRIRQRFDPIQKAYEDFLKRHPDHARAHVAYGSFLGDLHDEEGAEKHWKKALELDPQNPAVYNNLANLYGHIGPVTNSFAFYTKAIELNPLEPIYYQNFAATIYLFRKDAGEFYGITEQEVFTRALDLYEKAVKLDPDNFPLASDLAQSYYGIKPTRTEDALKAWNYALKIAHDDVEREGVYIHLARFKLNAGRFDEARHDLSSVTNAMYADLKKRVTRSLEDREAQAKGTNAANNALDAKTTNTLLQAQGTNNPAPVAQDKN
jgi:tetratricopeptide (TPR) repeat protein